MRNFIVLFFACMILCATSALAQKRDVGIVAIVNEHAVTRADLDERMIFVRLTTGMPNEKAVINKVRPQILNILVEEEIKRQEAERLKITVDGDEIMAAVTDIAKQNKMDAGTFLKMFSSKGIPVATFKKQIEAQLLWMKIVARQIKPKIQISETDIDVELESMRARIGQKELNIAVIELPPLAGENGDKVRELSSRIVPQLKKEPQSFPMIARQFSVAAGAQNGGDMGWVLTDTLDENSKAALDSAINGDVVGPVDAITGTFVYLVRDTRIMDENSIPSRDAIAYRLGLERLDRMQRRYLQDLRLDSFVETRL